MPPHTRCSFSVFSSEKRIERTMKLSRLSMDLMAFCFKNRKIPCEKTPETLEITEIFVVSKKQALAAHFSIVMLLPTRKGKILYFSSDKRILFTSKALTNPSKFTKHGK